MSLPHYSVGQKFAVLDNLFLEVAQDVAPEPPRALFWTTTNKLPKIYTANHATFTILVHLRYTRMAGFGRREIEYMQALCIYNKYIECYSVLSTLLSRSGYRMNQFHLYIIDRLIIKGENYFPPPRI